MLSTYSESAIGSSCEHVSAQVVHTEPLGELGVLGWLIDSETGFLSSLVASFLQPPLAGWLGVCLETT